MNLDGVHAGFRIAKTVERRYSCSGIYSPWAVSEIPPLGNCFDAVGNCFVTSKKTSPEIRNGNRKPCFISAYELIDIWYRQAIDDFYLLPEFLQCNHAVLIPYLARFLLADEDKVIPQDGPG